MILAVHDEKHSCTVAEAYGDVTRFLIGVIRVVEYF